MPSPAAVFVGSDTLLLQCIEAWRERGLPVAAVATDADKVRRYCAENGLRCLAADELASKLQDSAFDYLFAITWLRILPAEVLAMPKQAAINFHDGPLPRYAGLNAPVWALHNGESEHAISWHIIEAEADTGDLLLQRSFPIEADDTAFTLNARCFEHGQATFAQLAEQLQNGTVQPQAQDLARRTYFGRGARPADLAVLDFSRPATEVARLVRAFDHAGYQNPIAIAKVWAPAGVFVPGPVRVIDDSGSAPGTVLAVSDDGVRVACGGGAVELRSPRCLRGHPLGAQQLLAMGVAEGAVLPTLDASARQSCTALGEAAAAGERAWVDGLRRVEALPVPDGQPAGDQVRAEELAVGVVAGDADAAAARCVAFLLRNAGVLAADIGYCNPTTHELVAALPEMAVACPPVHFEIDASASVAAAESALQAAIAATVARGPLLRELVVRRPDALSPAAVLEVPVRIAVGVELPVDPGTLTLLVAADGSVRLRFDAAALPAERAQALAARLAVFAGAVQQDATTPLVAMPTLAADERERLLRGWNDTATDPIAEPCLHRQFAAVAAQRPDDVALRFGGDSMSYRELLVASNRLAGWLRGRGVQVGDRVGICTGRGFGMVTAVLATLRCGAAYVPLDPSYPRERLTFMAEDAELAALVVDRQSLEHAPTAPCPRIDLDADRDAIESADVLLDDEADGDRLAYMIYTSGSTGRPKGVMVRHRNAANFFVGMDAVLGTDRPGFDVGTWLAVTSLSFDISVLELLWTLCRGFSVVLFAGEDQRSEPAAAPAPTRPISFSMFYFASDEGEHQDDKYRLLKEGATFADRNGFEAVWTPERHFHAFGGLYPNPAVASAAIAAMTENVQIRAGSCVVPLHHPIRVAEDWSLVDNLSNGRVGIAAAAGWHGRDFVLRKESFERRKQVMMETIETVQKLWRGEEVEFEGHDGKLHKIKTLPRPIQKRLPVWVTVAGNPETYRMAGEAGHNVLTHLLGQSLEELAQKLDIYRQAWRKAGHPGEGRVTLMLHTFVGTDEQRVREIVREPMKGYLRSSLDLVKQAAWSFPAFKNRVDKPGEMDELLNGGLTPADFEALLDFSFERYYQTSGLFGTPDSCVAIVDRLRAMQIDEIACLVDFGVPTQQVVDSLPHLLELKQRCDARAAAAGEAADTAPAVAANATIPELIERFAVTHFQCTPSMAGMLMLDPAAPAALRRLQHMLVGGEALPASLASQLCAEVPKLHDVYGPTETTVWSTTMPLAGGEDPVPIGRPLKNQQVYVLDNHLQPVPTGSAGELWIGGDGVTAGYFRRPELTDEKFRPDPFRPDVDGAKIYATGDLVRWRDDGVLEYLGRKDLQVKVRGYRIELGEIEAALAQHSGVREVVVVARSDHGEPRLVAYYVKRKDARVEAELLREHLRGSLPEFMVPSHFVALPDLPRTPNMKVDRKALPAPESVAAASNRQVVSAADDTENAILEIWKQGLGTDDVGVEDNFFDSGGHSILAVKVHREIVQRLGVELQVTDLFRFTTVRALARHLQSGKEQPTAAQQAMERAKKRRRTIRRG